MENKTVKHDSKRDRNTAIMNIVVAMVAIGLAMLQGGGFTNGRFLLKIAVAVANVVAAGYYFGRYIRKISSTC